MQIIMDNSQINVQSDPSGVKVIVVTDAVTKLVVVVPLNPDAAKQIGAALSASGIVVPHLQIPPGILKHNGGMNG